MMDMGCTMWTGVVIDERVFAVMSEIDLFDKSKKLTTKTLKIAFIVKTMLLRKIL